MNKKHPAKPTVKQAAKTRLIQQLENGTRHNGMGKGSGHALKKDLEEKQYTTFRRYK